MHRGYIKLWRKILDSAIMHDADLLHVWIHCLVRASHKDRQMLVGKMTVNIKAGQFITGREALRDELYPTFHTDEHGNRVKNRYKRPSSKTIFRWLKVLENMQNLSIDSSSKFSIITITNWAAYQSEDAGFVQKVVPFVSRQCPDDVPPMSTNKNDKNEKNGENVNTDRHARGDSLAPLRKAALDAFAVAYTRTVTSSEDAMLVRWLQSVETLECEVRGQTVNGLDLAAKAIHAAAQGGNCQTVRGLINYAKAVMSRCVENACWPGEFDGPDPAIAKQSEHDALLAKMMKLSKEPA